MSGWIGCDFDGTLAEHEPHGSIETCGAPIPDMVERVKKWLAEGIEVRIVTARMSFEKYADRWRQMCLLEEWCEKHIGQRLPATNVKDFGMIELWDDRAVQVVRNTGLRADQVAVDNTAGAIASWLHAQGENWQECDARDLAADILRGDWKPK